MTNINAAGVHCECGLALPTALCKKDGDWKMYCECDWEALEKEVRKDPTSKSPVNIWYNHLKEQFGASVDTWPEVGCGAR
eukprot:6705278-Prorocentrum_lima.AAC.1